MKRLFSVMPVITGLVYVMIFPASSLGAEVNAAWIAGSEKIDAPTIDESVIVDGALPYLVKAEKPATPALTKGQAGGIDSGLAGDGTGFMLASPRDKRWKGGKVNPQTIHMFFTTAADAKRIEIELGYRLSKSQTRQFSIAIDGRVLEKFRLPKGTFGSRDTSLKSAVYAVTFKDGVKRPDRHVVTVNQDDWWGVTVIDAVRIRGKGCETD